MFALVEDKVLPRDHQVTCLVLGADTEVAPKITTPATKIPITFFMKNLQIRW
jgi:hypothetical protein